MRLLSRHILTSLAAPFGWGVVALTGMLLLNSLAPLIDRFGGKGLPASVMVEAIVLALPALLTLTLPMAVLTAALYAYGQLAADLEMVAMYANGVSVWRMARPALIAAVAVSLVNFVIFDQIVPRSNARYTTLQQDVLQKLPTLTLRPQVLNPLQGTQYILQAAEIDPVSGAMEDVVIYDLSSSRGTRVIRAERGVMGEAPNRTDLMLTLYAGEMYEPKPLDPGRLERTEFATNQVRVVGVANALSRRTDRWDRSDRELTGCELLAGIDSAAWYRQEGKARRELLTRRDLRRLVGLPPLSLAPARTMPELAPRCVAYKPVERFFERVLLGSNNDPPPSTPPEETADTVTPAPAETAATRPGLPSIPVPPPAPVIQQPATPPPGVRYNIPTPVEPVLPAPDTTTIKKRRPIVTDSAAQRVADSTAAAGTNVRDTASTPPATPSATPAATAPGVQPLDASGLPLGDGAPGQDSSTAPIDFLVPPEVAPQEQAGLVSTIVDVNSARNQDEQSLRTTRKFAVEYHKKFAIPLASFGFVLVAMALALKYPRSGIGLVIGGSLLIFLGFYILLIGGENLADGGYISAAVAMYAPLVLFTLLGLGAVASANREMGTSRSSGIVQAMVEGLQSLLRRRQEPA